MRGVTAPTAGSTAALAAAVLANLALALLLAVGLGSSGGNGVTWGGSLLYGAAYVLRAVGDVGSGVLSWVSPIGWPRRTYAYAGDRWWPLPFDLALAAACDGGGVDRAGLRVRVPVVCSAAAGGVPGWCPTACAPRRGPGRGTPGRRTPVRARFTCAPPARLIA